MFRITAFSNFVHCPVVLRKHDVSGIDRVSERDPTE
jgi:hypothetical protein